MPQRAFMANLSAAATAAGAALFARARSLPDHNGANPNRLNGRVRHSVCHWCYDRMSLEQMCKAAASIGIESVELLGEHEWHVPAKYGLTCAMAMGPMTIIDGLNRAANHERIRAACERILPLIANAGIPNMIVFSGNRAGISDDEGICNCIAGLKQLMPLAEQHRVTLCMELLNSRIDHPDYHADRTAWGVEVVKSVGSERFKLLYDIYHMQIMEGDVIRTIREHIDCIGHFHTGGVPGRNEIDASQELNYPAICRAIVETGYTGYIGQEFIPKRDPVTSLREAVSLCNV